MSSTEVRQIAREYGPICGVCYARGAMRLFRFFAAILLVAVTQPYVWTAAQSRPPLGAEDITAIATLLKLEDTLQFDKAALAPLPQRSHPEVRRLAVLAMGRIADARGKSLIVTASSEKD